MFTDALRVMALTGGTTQNEKLKPDQVPIRCVPIQ